MKQLHLSERFQAAAADKLISTLKQKLAANEEYIAELEEGVSSKYEDRINSLEEAVLHKNILISDLEENITSIKLEREEFSKNYTQLNTKYQLLLNNPESFVIPYKKQIESLQSKIKELTKVRDTLIAKLNHD